MATLYYNAAVDTDWATLGNWWTSDAFTTPASALPTSSDSVVLSATCDANSGSEPTVVNMTMTGNDGFRITITVTGQASFEGYTFTDGTITGDCTFADNSSSDAGTINGNCTFNDSSYTLGSTITGDCTFNDYSLHNSTITGDCTFNNSSTNPYGGITGDCTFNNSSINGDPDGISTSFILGNATFNDSSVNAGEIIGDATFSDNSIMVGDSSVSVSGSITIGGNPIRMTLSALFTASPGFLFTRAQLGINGSSILGVV